jgi:hypothetical protein
VAPNSEVQRVGADALIDAWDHLPWPNGFISISTALGTDGASVHHYSQWRDQAKFDAFIADGTINPAPYIVERAPNMTMTTPVQYTLYRSERDPSDAETGCLAFIEIEFDGPDEQRQHDWVNAVFDALRHDAETGLLPPGGLAAHFHVSLDGRRILNVAEWESEEAHIAALNRGGGRSLGSGGHWGRVQKWPGLLGFDVRRYVPYRLKTTGLPANV